MRPYSRQASVRWSGKGQRAKTTTYKPGSALKITLHPNDGDGKARGVNPPELIAAAHAGSFSLTLANVLAEAGYQPRQIDTTATVMMERIAKTWTLTQIHLDVIARVPKAAECDFVDAALQAKAHCPISRALNANISMRAKLTRNP
jgi:osmotically inducible protein OsmC